MEAKFKQAMSHFATGVCVVTYRDPQTNQADGVTISAFSSLSLKPEKILFCLGRWGGCDERFSKINEFNVNILNHSHTSLAYQFAGHDRSGLSEHIFEVSGLPAIKNSLAVISCDKGNVYPEGDHDIIIGDVRNIELQTQENQPLLYYKSTIIKDYQHG